jgi:hypothetical protein
MCAVVEMRAKMDMPQGYFEYEKPLSAGVQDCIQALVQMKPSELKSILHGTWRKTVSWHHRAAGAFLYLHPLINGKGGINHRFDKVSKVLGVDACTFQKWFSLHDAGSKGHMEKWVPLVKEMKWTDVAEFFAPDWVTQWAVPGGDTVLDQLGPYEKHIEVTQVTILSKYSPETTTAGRTAAARNDANTFILKMSSKRHARNDTARARKYLDQENYVINMIQKRWDIGDPIGKLELYGELSAMDECAEGTDFYQNYLDPLKGKSVQCGLSNWTKRVLRRFSWSPRKNSIGQTVPEDWRNMSEINAAKLCKKFRDAKVDVMLNSDQTFVHFYPDEEVVILASKGTKRVGGKVKSDAKAGFTAMVTCDLGSSRMADPFVVYNGTKLVKAKNPTTTLAYKYKDRRVPSSKATLPTWLFRRNIGSMKISRLSYLISSLTKSILARRLEFLWTWPRPTAQEEFQHTSRRKKKKAAWSSNSLMVVSPLCSKSVICAPTRSSRLSSRNNTSNGGPISSMLREPKLPMSQRGASNSRSLLFK